MIGNFARAAVAVTALVALPGVAQAGTTTATANVTMQVGSQCTLTGANVHLGSFKTTDTWGTVGAKHGSINVLTYSSGTVGKESLNYGSVTCDLGLPWSLSIKGTNTGTYAGAIKITLNGKVSVMYPGIKRVGTVSQADTSSMSFPGTGVQAWNSNVTGVGTGTAQDLIGNITVSYSSTGVTATSTTALGAVGSGTDTMTYTLTF